MQANHVKNSQANVILEYFHGILDNMVHSLRLEGKHDLNPMGIEQLIVDVAWAFG